MTDDDPETPAGPAAPVNEREEMEKELDLLQAMLRGAREQFGDQTMALLDTHDPDQGTFSDEHQDRFEGAKNMLFDFERTMEPRIDRLQRRLEALNHEDLTRASLNASQGVARATWVLAAATVVLALATLALIWATVSA